MLLIREHQAIAANHRTKGANDDKPVLAQEDMRTEHHRSEVQGMAYKAINTAFDDVAFISSPAYLEHYTGMAHPESPMRLAAIWVAEAELLLVWRQTS